MAIAAVALTSCKKDEPATSELGEATISGNVWADLDQTNDTENGVYVQSLNPEGVVGMQVSVEINTQNLAQNPIGGYDYEIKTYTAMTDASGNYTLTLPATDDAFTVTLMYQDIYTTRTVLAEDGMTGISENVEVSLGNRNVTIYSGATIAVQDEASVSTTNASAENYGTATVKGNIYADWNQGIAATCTSPYPCFELCDASSPFAGRSLWWAYYDGPYGEGEGIWNEIAIAADGSYEITVTTEGASGGTVGIDYGFADFEGTRTGQNNAGTADSTYNCIWKINGVDGVSQGGIESGEIILNDIGYDIYFNDL